MCGPRKAHLQSLGNFLAERELLTLRRAAIGVALGLLLGLAISCFTYFNDWYIRQTFLTGNHLPIAVFGVMVVLLLGINPLLRRIRESICLSPGQLGLIVAIGLASCGWPGSNFFRPFTGITALPGHLMKNQPSWQQVGAMSFIPGGSAKVAPGYVIEPADLAGQILAADAPGRPVVLEQLDEDSIEQLRRIVAAQPVTQTQRTQLRGILNSLITDPQFHTRLPDSLEIAKASELQAHKRSLLEEAQGLQTQREQLISQREQVREQFAEQLQTLTAQRKQLSEQINTLNQQRRSYQGDLADQSNRINRLERNLAELQRDDEPTHTVEQALANARQAAGALSEQLQQVQAELDEFNERQSQVSGELDRVMKRVSANDGQIASLLGVTNYLREEASQADYFTNRAALVAMFPEHIRSAPRGEGVLVAGGRADEFAVNTLVTGWDGRPWGLGVSDLPWRIWQPVLKLWGPVAVLLGIVALCLTLIVHPQWSHRELLPYPIARFVQEATATRSGDLLPTVARSKLFWIAFLVVMFIHVVNGINVWFPALPKIPMQLNFGPLGTLFPLIRQSASSLFHPLVFPSVIAFAYFLQGEVSLSLGLSVLAWGILGAILISAGQPLENAPFDPQIGPMIRFGGYLGLSIILLYIGRRYYMNLAASAVGLQRQRDTPLYATWALRVLVLCVIIVVAMLRMYTGLNVMFGLIIVGLLMLMFVVMTRINVETGCFFLQAWFIPVAVVLVVFGVQGVGLESMVILSIVSVLIVTDPRTAIMPYLANSFKIGEDVSATRPGRLAWPVGAMLVIGFVAALIATLFVQYNTGAFMNDHWANSSPPSAPFNTLVAQHSELSARGELIDSVRVEGLSHFTQMTPMWGMMGWIGLGLGLVIAVSLLRLRLPWWPLHPVIFLVWGTYPLNRFWFSFFAGWMIKSAVTRVGGAKQYHAVKPMMVGLIAGELSAAMLWMIIGTAYYFATGKAPLKYAILPT